jgi:hypothetical protein
LVGIEKRLKTIQDRIADAARSRGRPPDSVRLVVVGKTWPAQTVEKAIEAGANIIGENYIQEARDKINALYRHSVSWHFIGHLQSNKAKYAVRLFDLIHSVDSFKLASEIDKQARKVDKIQEILIQVNVGEESTKSGIRADETLSLVKRVIGLENVKITGLMTIPPFFDDPVRVRPYFRNLKTLRDQIRNDLPADVFSGELSMGMTGDFSVAIEEGATLVRIGTAIFGERS